MSCFFYCKKKGYREVKKCKGTGRLADHWHRYIIKQDKVYYDRKLQLFVHKITFKCVICQNEHIKRAYFLKRR